jgi:hypothetical protein
MENLNIEVGATVVEFDGKIITFSNGYTLELGKVKAPKKKPEKVVTVYAFTGMRIGELEVVSETEEEIVVKKGDGKKMKFDKKTGIQTDCKKPRYANRLQA